MKDLCQTCGKKLSLAVGIVQLISILEVITTCDRKVRLKSRAIPNASYFIRAVENNGERT